MDVEKVIATPLWVQDLLRESRQPSPNAFDAKLRPDKKKIRNDGAGISTSGLIARYSRGDSSPSRSMREWLIYVWQYDVEMLDHPLWKQLRDPGLTRIERVSIQLEIDSFLCSRLFGPRTPGDVALRPRSHTSVTRRKLAAQGDEYALSALITLLDEEVESATPWPDAEDPKDRLEEARHDLNLLPVGEDICHCLVLLISDTRFHPARTALVARMRQRILDSITSRNGRLATTHYDFIGLADDVARLRARTLSPHDLRWSPPARRRFHLDLLAGKLDPELALRLCVPRLLMDGTIDDPLQRVSCIPRPIRLELPPTDDGRQGERGYGKIAKRILREGLGEYWVDAN